MSTLESRYYDALSDLSVARLLAQSRLFSWELADSRDLLAVQIAEFTVKLARSELADCLPVCPPCEEEFPDELCAFHSAGGQGPCNFCEDQ